MNLEMQQRIEQQVDQYGRSDAEIVRSGRRERLKVWVEVLGLWNLLALGMVFLGGAAGDRPWVIVLGGVMVLAFLVGTLRGDGIWLFSRLATTDRLFLPLSEGEALSCSSALGLCARSVAAEHVRAHALKRCRQLYGFDHQLMRVWAEKAPQMEAQAAQQAIERAHCAQLHSMHDPF